jgi:hypothetical protein
VALDLLAQVPEDLLPRRQEVRASREVDLLQQVEALERGRVPGRHAPGEGRLVGLHAAGEDGGHRGDPGTGAGVAHEVGSRMRCGGAPGHRLMVVSGTKTSDAALDGPAAGPIELHPGLVGGGGGDGGVGPGGCHRGLAGCRAGVRLVGLGAAGGEGDPGGVDAGAGRLDAAAGAHADEQDLEAGTGRLRRRHGPAVRAWSARIW